MQFYYGEQNIVRALDEAEFWKHQEAEHADLIPVVTPNLEPEYVQNLEQIGLECSALHEETVRYTESITRLQGAVDNAMKTQMMNLIKRCIAQSLRFIDYMEEMLRQSQAVRSNKTSQTVIHHMIRESDYFVGIDQLIVA